MFLGPFVNPTEKRLKLLLPFPLIQCTATSLRSFFDSRNPAVFSVFAGYDDLLNGLEVQLNWLLPYCLLGDGHVHSFLRQRRTLAPTNRFVRRLSTAPIFAQLGRTDVSVLVRVTLPVFGLNGDIVHPASLRLMTESPNLRLMTEKVSELWTSSDSKPELL